MKREYRTMTQEIQLRQHPGPRLSTIVGYPVVFNQLSDDLGGFRERILPGAFKNLSKRDVRALVSHDPSQIIGRTKSGSLTLREDDHGLYAEIDPPNTQLARDMVELIRRGDLDGMSFGFSVPKDGYDWKHEGDMRIRELRDIELFDVSVVAFPAYSQTEVSVRSLWPDGMPEDVEAARHRMQHQTPIDRLPTIYRVKFDVRLKEFERK